MSCRGGQYGALCRLEKQFREELTRAQHWIQDDRHPLFFALQGRHAFKEISGREDSECVALGETATRNAYAAVRICVGCASPGRMTRERHRWGGEPHERSRRPGVCAI